MADWALKSNDFSDKHTESLFLLCKLVLHTLQVLIMAHPFLHFYLLHWRLPVFKLLEQKEREKVNVRNPVSTTTER